MGYWLGQSSPIAQRMLLITVNDLYGLSLPLVEKLKKLRQMSKRHGCAITHEEIKRLDPEIKKDMALFKRKGAVFQVKLKNCVEAESKKEKLELSVGFRAGFLLVDIDRGT